ncbi:uncharacterized protein [Amphiura filiformis]|uniref:uncharacterized protein n=1 Tax=Amphiura filiformis TaxID=82378 RepID=UPI003B222651
MSSSYSSYSSYSYSSYIFSTYSYSSYSYSSYNFSSYSYISDATGNQPSSSKQNNFAVGIGTGIGICVLLALIVGLLVYCRIRGRKEEKKRAESESRSQAVEIHKRNDNSEEYAEISDHKYAGERSLQGTVNLNPAYSISLNEETGPHHYQTLDTSNQSSSGHQYKSLKKPNQDMGSGEYADPDKYTEPLTLPHYLTLTFEEKTENLDEDYERVSTGAPLSYS